MPCNCGGGGSGARTIAQRNNQAAFRAAGSPVGFDRDHPLLIGEAGDGEVWRVRVMVPVENLTVGAATFVTGQGVRAHIASGALHDITTTNQKKRLWRVGITTYTSEQDARRVAAATGQTPIEVA